MLRIARCPALYVLTLVLALVTHACLCYPAATCRGHPALDPIWQFLAIYLGFFGVALAPAFDDFENDPHFRQILLGTFTLFACLLLGVAQTNLSDARPHIGHVAGYWGVIYYGWIVVIISALTSILVAGPFVFCLESVARGCWDYFRRIERQTADQSPAQPTA